MGSLMDDRRLAVVAILAGSAALAAAIMRFLSPFPADEAAFEAFFASAAADAPDAPNDLANFAPRVCFLDRADRLAPDVLERAQAARPSRAPADAAVVALFEADGSPRLLAPDPGALAWDRADHGGAFCAQAAYASYATSGGVFIYKFDGATPLSGAAPPAGAPDASNGASALAREGLHILAE